MRLGESSEVQVCSELGDPKKPEYEWSYVGGGELPGSSQAKPAKDCKEINEADAPSGEYYVKNKAGKTFKVSIGCVRV